jgi:uncharacterized protein (DUF2062 family)
LSLKPCTSLLNSDELSILDNGLSPLAIGLIVGGIVLALIVGVILAVVLYKKKQEERF